MNAQELESLVEMVTRKVLAALSERTAPKPGAGNCPCKGACTGSESRETVVEAPSEKPEQRDETGFSGRLLTETALRGLSLNGARELVLSPGTIVTPLARDRAAATGLRLREGTSRESRRACAVRPTESTVDRVSYYSARTVMTVEKIVTGALAKVGAAAHVCPVNGKVEEELAGALACAGHVSEGSSDRAIILAENVYLIQRHAGRLPGVRARVCWDARSALESRRCDDTNVLLLSGRMLGMTMIRRTVEAWLSE